MLIYFQTTMLKENLTFTFDTDEDDIGNLRERLETWVSELDAVGATIRSATIKVSVENPQGEALEIYERFIGRISPKEIGGIDHLVCYTKILLYIEEDAGAQEIAKLLYLAGGSELPEYADDWISDENVDVFESLAEMAEGEYASETPDAVCPYVDWEAVGENYCSYSTEEVRGTTYYIKD